MVFWQSHIFFVLLLAFSGLNLIYSDCGTDFDRLNGDGEFCNNRNLRHVDDISYRKELSRRRIQDFSKRIVDERADLRGREIRQEFDELRRDSRNTRRTYLDDEHRRVEREERRVEREERRVGREERRFERRNDLNRRIQDERAERDRVYDVARRDVVRRGMIRNEQDSRIIRREIVDARLRLAQRERLDASHRNERTEMDQSLSQLSGNRRRLETRAVREANVDQHERNIRLSDERRVDASERMELHQRRISTEINRREGERRLERERKIDEQQQQDRSERTERNSINRESGEHADRRETQRLDRRLRIDSGERRNEIRKLTTAEERRMRSIESDSRQNEQTKRENEESRRSVRSGHERIIRMEARRNDDYREVRNNVAHMSGQQNILGADAELITKKSKFTPSGLAWPLLELAILGAIIVHIIKKEDIKPKSFEDHFKGFFTSTTAKTVKAL